MPPTRRLVFLALLTGAALTCARPSDAADWMFRRSYYTHAPEPWAVPSDYPRNRSAYRDPIVSGHPRFAIRGGWRYNSFRLQNGNSTDNTIIRENWFDMNY